MLSCNATSNSGNSLRMSSSTTTNSATINPSKNTTAGQQQQTTPKEVSEIRLNLANDWKVLSSIHQMLVDEKAFCADPQEWHEKIVDFVQPDELKVGVCTGLKNNES